MTRTITMLFLFVFSITLNAQNIELSKAQTSEILLGKWITRKITYRNPNNSVEQIQEFPALKGIFYDFKNDGTFGAHPLSAMSKGNWELSEDSKKITLNRLKPTVKDKKVYLIVKLTENELTWKITSTSGSEEYVMTRFDPNHKDPTVKFKFYKTYEDMINEKVVASYNVVSWGDSDFSSESFKFENSNGKIEKLKVGDFPSEFYRIGEDKLYRVYKKESYRIIVYGEFCYYAVPGFSQKPERYSETISGSVKNFNNGILQDKLKEIGLLEAYRKDKPKREFRDNVQEYFDKEVARNIKYIILLNKALGKK